MVRDLAVGHALRYSLAVAIATATYRFLHVDHGYWGALAVAFSLRPDFASTILRSLGRILGTSLGVFAATSFVNLFHPSAAALTAAMLGAVWLAFALQNATYIGFSAGLAFYVVVSVGLSGLAFSTVGFERITATAAGSLFALAVSILWPIWQAENVRQLLAVAYALQASYADAVLNRVSAEEMQRARFQARGARLQAEQMFSSAALEPRWSRRRNLDGASAALAKLAENAAFILSAHMAALSREQEPPEDELRRISEQDRALAADLMG